MLKQKNNNICIGIIVGNISFYIVSAVFFAMYIVSDYIPFVLLSVAAITLSALITMQMLFKRSLKLKQRGDKPFSQNKVVAFLQKIVVFIVKAFNCAVDFYNKHRVAIKLIVTFGLFVAFHALFLRFLRYLTTPVIAIWQPVVVAVLFIITIVVDKICFHIEPQSELYVAVNKNIRVFIKFIYFLLALTIVFTALNSLGLWNGDNILKYIIAIVFYYISTFVIISYIGIIVKKTVDDYPLLVIPVPFLKTDKDGVSVLDYLEQNTGVSMRGLWSMRFVKQIAPVTVFVVAVLLWLSTSIVQINSNSEGAVYRLGVLQKNTLSPGIHMVLPYPIDNVEIYNTKTLNTITIGYSSKKTGDNLWTGSHGAQEHKLLLGSGDELVSINLRLEYRISDTIKYLTSTSSPVKFLEAQAYDLVTDMTINTDLTELLSTDRDAFSKSFENQLSKTIKSYDLGIELVNVVLESIHPPIEVAGMFQSTVSAQIEAEQIITEAQMFAEEVIVGAKETSNDEIATATEEYYTKLAAAQTEVAEFMAGVEAYNTYSKEYKYYKYLSAVSKAYNNSKLVIVGKGIDSSRIYFGSFSAAEAKE